jgi:hypothetical protein
VIAVHKAPGDYPSGKDGDTDGGIHRVGIPVSVSMAAGFRHIEAFSSEMAARKVRAAGAKTAGAFPGK